MSVGWLHARPLHGSRANGPGSRSVVWLQGCALRCPGCHNPETHGFFGRIVMEARELAEELARQAEDGVTWSGGEPMHQARFVDEVMEQACRIRHELGKPPLSWGLFTGYTEQELEEGRIALLERGLPQMADPAEASRLWQRIRGRLDFAVLGRYDAARRRPAGLLASDNQVLRIWGLSQAAFAADAFDEILIDGRSIVRTGFGPGRLVEIGSGLAGPRKGEGHERHAG